MDVAHNVSKALAWLERAATELQPDLVVFPETISTGFHPNMEPGEFWKLLEPIDGPTVTRVASEAARHRLHVVWPTWERGDNGIIHNSAALIGPDGRTLGVYRKTHPFPTERVYTTPGTTVEPVETELGRIGMVICYDGDFPELVRTYALKGAEVVLRPSALLRDYEIWSLTNRARAYDNQIYFVAVNSVGADAKGNYYFGHSMVVDPLGNIVSLARGGEQMIAADLDPATRGKSLVQHLDDRNPGVYRC
jgi:predicted amidohydrolase